MIEWSPVRGADLYETRAVDASEVILCNDTAPVCALSDLTCNSRYSVVVIPCNDLRGCNLTCSPQTHETGKTTYTHAFTRSVYGTEVCNLSLFLSKAPCMPENIQVNQSNSSSVLVSWTSSNTAANYRVSVIGSVGDTHSCQSNGTSCLVPNLPCGSVYEVSAIAYTTAGQSMPSYTVPLETG